MKRTGRRCRGRRYVVDSQHLFEISGDSKVHHFYAKVEVLLFPSPFLSWHLFSAAVVFSFY